MRRQMWFPIALVLGAFTGAAMAGAAQNTVDQAQYAQILADQSKYSLDVFPMGAGCAMRVFGSGWQAIQPGQYLRIFHNLGSDPDDYFVYLDFYMDHQQTPGAPWDSTGTHQIYYGGMKSEASGFHGAKWSSLTDRQIILFREPGDVRVNKIRVRIVNTSCR
jgi:hypothetical protein